MPLDTSLARVLREPGDAGLSDLRADLLALSDGLTPAERTRADRTIAIAGRFRQYLSDLLGKTSAHEYSQWASQLDMGSVGLLALQDLATDREQLFKKLFLGGLSELLMVVASRQYVKAWRAEAEQVHDEAIWWLFEAFWRLSRELSPDLPADRRRAAIDTLMADARAREHPSALRAALIVGLFQMLLVGSLGWAAPPRSAGGALKA